VVQCLVRGEHAERSLVRFAFTGAYAPLFFAMLFCNVLAPQAFWFRAVRRSIAAVFALAVAINVGMWLERILIIWNTLSHGYTPSMWRLYLPTIWDWLTTFGSLGLSFSFFSFSFAWFRPCPCMRCAISWPRRSKREQDAAGRICSGAQVARGRRNGQPARL